MTDHPAAGSATTDGASAAAQAEAEGLSEADVLVEEVSIDGMCGVY
jgi:mycofactocin precursor